MTRRSGFWDLLTAMRIIELLRRWCVSADRSAKYRNSRRRGSDIQYGRRRSDVTSPRWAGSFHLHILPTLLLGAAIALLLHWLWLGMTIR